MVTLFCGTAEPRKGRCEVTSVVSEQAKEERGKFFAVEVDGVEYLFEQEQVTGAEIMAKAGIPQSVGMVQILDDGTQETVALDAVFDLKPGRRFKKRPKFRRG